MHLFANNSNLLYMHLFTNGSSWCFIRCGLTDGLRENAKEKQVGFPLHMSRSKKTYRWAIYAKYNPLLDLYLTLNPHKVSMIIAFAIMYHAAASVRLWYLSCSIPQLFSLFSLCRRGFVSLLKSKWFVIIIRDFEFSFVLFQNVSLFIWLIILIFVLRL